MRLLFVLMTLLLSACRCGSAPCDASSCSRCCDSSGACVAGTSAQACGSSGAACQACSSGCEAGRCTTSSGGGSAGGGFAGGSSMAGGAAQAGGSAVAGGAAVDAGPWLTLAEYCPRVGEAAVRAQSRCGHLDAAQDGGVQRAVIDFQCAQSLSVLSGRVRISRGGAEALIADFTDGGCLNLNPFFDVIDDERVFIPQQDAGEPCFEGECARGLYCDSRNVCPGRCAPRIAIGQPATGICVEGAHAYGGTCVANIPVGQSCAPTGGLTGRHKCAAGVCSAVERCELEVLVPSGGACSEHQHCPPSEVCAVGGTCVPRKRLGEVCNYDCLLGLNCEGGVCVAPGGIGDPCSASQPCLWNAFCGSNAVCVPLRTEGQTCQVGQCIQSLYCNAATSTSLGVCKRHERVGAGCNPMFTTEVPCTGGTYCSPRDAGVGVCTVELPEGDMCTNDTVYECRSQRCTGNVCQPGTTRSETAVGYCPAFRE
ncbi:MAG: hypothetical protein ABTQ32_18935 [Myxococcaceae bacterium]